MQLYVVNKILGFTVISKGKYDLNTQSSVFYSLSTRLKMDLCIFDQSIRMKHQEDLK